jgi:hypothetical protein
LMSHTVYTPYSYYFASSAPTNQTIFFSGHLPSKWPFCPRLEREKLLCWNPKKLYSEKVNTAPLCFVARAQYLNHVSHTSRRWILIAGKNYIPAWAN